MKSKYHSKLKRFHLLWGLLALAAFFVMSTAGLAPGTPPQEKNAPPSPAQPAFTPQHRVYPAHTNIVATMFYIGEPGSGENGFISNSASTWDVQWQDHYGGIDDPSRRNGWLPRDFTPKQNPFYVALPYSDLDDNKTRKASANTIYWSEPQTPGDSSLVKDRWIEICHNKKCAYGQWEDAGPFGEDDVLYVFGPAQPANDKGLRAGIDVSPAINDYLGLGGSARVDWRFIDALAVPSGPWTKR